MLVSLLPPRPGISKKASGFVLSDRWTDGDKVRFVNGFPEKIGGWEKLSLTSVVNPIRGLQAWSTLRLSPFIAAGTHRKLYVVDQSMDPEDITPVESSGTLTNPFTTTVSDTLVNVTDTSHGRAVGDEVRFDNAVAVGGITIDGAYSVVEVLDEDNYVIQHSAAASSSAGPGGGTVDYEYELGIGAVDPLEGDGYGSGPYGLGDYGEPSEAGSSSIVFEPRVWSLEPYGDLLLANPSGRGIYAFDPEEDPVYQRAEAIANAPTVCRSIFMTPERFLMALGVDNDPMKIKWPDQDDLTNWTPASTNTSGDRRLQEGTRIIAGAGIADFLSGVWTDTALYRFQYTGSSFVYDSSLVGTNCGLIAPQALVTHIGVAYWMSPSEFLMWAGGGAPVPIPNSEDIREFVNRNLRSAGYEFKCNGHYNSRYNEIWWFYTPVGSTEPGLYVAVSLTDFSWTVGELERCSGTFFKSSDQRPILASSDGWLYQHEEGLDDDGAVMRSYVTRAPLRVQQGMQLADIFAFHADFERQVGPLAVEVKTYERLNEQVLETEVAFFDPGEDIIDLRTGGRIALVTIKSESLAGDYRLGLPMLEIRPGGKRRP